MNIPVTQGTLVRLIVLTVGSLAFAVSVPATGDPFAGSALLPSAVIVAATLSVLIREASARRTKLFESVRIELNKIRRLYHVSKNLSAVSQRFRSWFTDMHGHVYGYLSSFAGKDFEAYDGFNAAFRKLSYHIYTIPELESKKEEALFQDLLRTAATVAESRQQIKELWDKRLSAYGWSIVLLMGTGLVMTAVLAMGETIASRLSTGGLIASVLLALDLLWEVDTFAGEKKWLAMRYVENVGRLELGRKE